MFIRLIFIVSLCFLYKKSAFAQKDTVYTYFDEKKTIIKSVELYDNNRREGISLTYYPLRGVEYSITYSNGLKNGIFQHYYKSGVVKRYKVYNKDKLIWQVYYNPEGKIDFEEVFFEDKMIRTMYRNGVPEFNWKTAKDINKK